MRIAGIDPDTKAITIVVLTDEVGGAPKIFRIEAKGRRAEDRIEKLYEGLYVLPPEALNFDWAYIESPVLAQFKGKTNAKALRDQSMVIGLIRGYLWGQGEEHSLVDNTIWKKGLLGNGHASKEEIAAYAQKMLQVPTDQPQDAYDAACIAAWGCNNVPKGE
jgi:Holliday junction resolvasome RuvABC endonuclease subunit